MPSVDSTRAPTVLLLGHFHEPHVWSVEGGEVRILDAWFRSRVPDWLAPSADVGAQS